MVRGALILSGAGVVCKLLGMAYRVMLGNVLGTQGMGNYQLAYSVYNVLLVTASGGLPAALSSIAAKRFAKLDEEGAWGYLSAARRMMGLLGAAFGVLLYVCSDVLARGMGMPPIGKLLKAAAPAVFFAAITSAYRGFYQGAQEMLPSALSQICEQVVKFAAGLYCSIKLIPRGEVYGALGAMLGVSISDGVGLLAVRLAGGKGTAARQTRSQSAKKAGELMKAALPVTLGTAILPMLGSIDSLLGTKLLRQAGYSHGAASGLYGLYSGFVLPVVNLSGILASAISASMVPAIASAVANDRKDLQRRQFSLGLKLITVLGIPLSLALRSMAQPILGVMYPRLQAQERALAEELLRLMAPSALFAMAAQITGGMLQGMERMGTPVLHLGIGAVCKILLELNLIPMPGFHIKGAAMGSMVCYLIAAVLNTRSVLKWANGEYRFSDCWLKPLAAGAAMVVCMRKSHGLLCAGSPVLALLGAALLGMGVYGLGVILSGAIGRGDFTRQAEQGFSYRRRGLSLL